MDHTVALLLLGMSFFVSLALIALGLPGLWLMVAAVVAYGWLTGFPSIGVATIAVVLALALLGEGFGLWFGFGLARRFGGWERGGWGGLVGGLVGAVACVPVS